MKYLVIYRHEDEPHIWLMEEKEFKEFITDNPETHLLTKPCNLMEFPSHSALVMNGEVVNG